MPPGGDNPLKPFNCPLTGRLITAEDPLLLGEGDFSVLSNLRYTSKGIRGVLGQTKFNSVDATSTYPIIRSAYHFAKEYPSSDESHIVYQAFNSGETASFAIVNDIAIGSSGYSDGIAENYINMTDSGTFALARNGITFGAGEGFESGDYILVDNEVIRLGYLWSSIWTDSERGALGTTAAAHLAGARVVKILGKDESGSSIARLTSAPYGTLVYCNGKESKIWGGNGLRVGKFLDKNTTATVVTGTDANKYRCIKSHTSADDTKPITGSYYATYWKKDTDAVTASAWATSTSYYSEYSYDYTLAINNNLTDSNNLATIHKYGASVDSNTMLLLHLNNNVTDSSPNTPHTVTNNNVTFNSTYYKFGGYSGYFNRSNAYLTIQDNADFDFSGGNWTVEMWYKMDVFSAPQVLYYQQGSSSADYIKLYITTGGKLKLDIYATSSPIVELTGVTDVATPSWKHIVFQESGDVYSIYVNGVLDAQVSLTGIRPANYSGVVHIGALPGPTERLGGYLDEIRVSNIARYDTYWFDVQATEYGPTGGTSDLYVGSIMPIKGIYFNLQNANTADVTTTIFYWNGTKWTETTCIDRYIYDFKSSSWVNFIDTYGLAKPHIIDDVYLYWYKIVISGGIDTGTTIKQIYLKTSMQDIIDLWDGTYRPIASFVKYTSSGYTDETLNVTEDSWRVIEGTSNTYDISTYSELPTAAPSGTTNNYTYIGCVERASGLQIKIIPSKANTNAANLVVEYWNGDSWAEVSGLNDGTKKGTKTLASSGVVTWSPVDEGSEFKTNLSAGAGYRSTGFAINAAGAFAGKFFKSNVLVPFREDTPVNRKAQLEMMAYGGSDFTAGVYLYRLSVSATISSTYVYYVSTIPAPSIIRGTNIPAVWQDRVWLADEPSGNRNVVIASATGTCNIFNGSDAFRIQIGDDTAITAMGGLLNRFGADMSDMMVLTKEKSTWILAASGEGEDFGYGWRQVSDIGCPAPGTFKICDIGTSIQPGVNRQIAIWLSNAGVVVYDQASLQYISKDIQNYFDTWRSEYLKYSIVHKFTAFYDSRNQEYHLLVASGSSATDINLELVYSITSQKWFTINRTTGKTLLCGFQAKDANGSLETYGGGSTGYLYRLENGQTFDSTSIPYQFRLGAKALAGLMAQTTIRKIRLLAVSKDSTTAEVTIKDYIDTATTPLTAATISMVDASKRVAFSDNRGIRSVQFGPGLTHELDVTVTTSGQTTGTIEFEPLVLGGLFRVEREEMGG